uniref:G-protein coupled receptors family 1 profile domain-containing protein n=1 Tax=Meloidogyne enterolobii TaxID=390850 RepID=A0A6V7U4R9_MELEN|nr:unnamed protein product [Meloidogyne enterolobii]
MSPNILINSTNYSSSSLLFISSSSPSPFLPTPPSNNNLDNPPSQHVIQRSTAEIVEILMYSLCLCIGGPLNLFSFRRLISQIRRPTRQQQQFGSQLLLLKLNLNIADLITMFVYTLSQIIWMITFQWHFGDFLFFEPLELKNFKQCTPIWTIIGYELDLKMGTLNESDIEGKLKIFQKFSQVVAWERFYNMAHLLFLFWIPSLLIAASYTAILITLNSLSVVPEKIKINDWDNNNSLSTKCETINSNNTRIGLIAPLTIAKARQNAKRQAALILAAYLTFWSPYNLLAICNAWAQKDGTIRQISTITLPFLNGLIVVNPIVNPLIYGVFDKYKLCFTRK